MNLHEKVLSLDVFSLRWKEFFSLKKIQEEKKCSLSPRSQATSFFDDEVNQWKKNDATGLNTRLGLKNKTPQPPKGTNELECFIKDIQRELIVIWFIQSPSLYSLRYRLGSYALAL